MSFIDLSDAEGMFALLVEFVADARGECLEDPERQQFLEELLTQLRDLESQLADIAMPSAIARLGEIHEAIAPGFAGDEVSIHLQECVEELERAEQQGQ